MKKLLGVSAAFAFASSAWAGSQFFHDANVGLIEGVADNGVGSGAIGANNEYFRWVPGSSPMSIGGVSPGGGVGGQGKISNDGRYISGTTFNSAMGYHEMSRYDANTGSWTGFGAIPGIGIQIDQEVSSGWAVTGDGSAVGGLGWTSQGTADTHAFMWQDGVGAIDLGTANTGTSARINGLNLDGSVAVGWQDGNGRQGSAWVNGTQELISDGGGNPAQEAFDVSGDGQWVTGLGVGGFTSPGNAYRYNTATNTHEALPNLAAGAARFMAGAGITDDGQTVVGGTWGFGPATFGIAYIWREGMGTMRIDDYLDSINVAYPDGFNFAFASAISSDGQWIAGWGGPGSGGSWIVNIPEPSSILLIGLAGFMLRRR